MNIEENEITAFIGPSGCGKSTLLRAINRMNDLVEGYRKEGEIFLDNKEIWKDIDQYALRKEWEWFFKSQIHFLCQFMIILHTDLELME